MEERPLIAAEDVRPLRRGEYDRLVELGYFDGERIELLYGALVAKEPQYAPHASTIRRLDRLFQGLVGDRAEVCAQTPLAVSAESEPEPDIAIAPPGDYRKRHPRTALLVIEVSYSALYKDRAVKAPLYAAADIPEYWIVNLPESVVEVHRRPWGNRYRTVTRHSRGETLRPVWLRGVSVRVDDILG
jgi:Uma2 family endonuclease